MIEIGIVTRTAPALSRDTLSGAYNRTCPAYSRETAHKINLGKQMGYADRPAPPPEPRQQPRMAWNEPPRPAAKPLPPALRLPELQRPVARGQKTPLDMPQGASARLRVAFGWNVKDARCDIDASAFLLGPTDRVISDAWFQVFPDNKTPEGRPVAQLLQYGNHDVASWREKDYPDPAERARNLIKFDPKGYWERAFKEEYTPCFAKTVNGITFVGAHWPGLGGLNAWLDANGSRLDPSLPFFYFQHPHPKDTCYGPWAWGHDDGSSTKALSAYPNAIALSGHSHYTLTDERTVWQGAFTSIGTSSLSYTSLDYNFRENAAGNGYGVQERRARQMPRLVTTDGKQGMLFTICDDHIRIERREFVWGESLGDDWILPVGKGAEKPYAYAKRTPVRLAPEFPRDAEVKVAKIPAGKDKDGKPTPERLEVSFPAAEARGKCRVFEYEVRAVVVADDVELVAASRRVIAPDFHLPAPKAGKRGSCVFACSELPPKTPLRFDVQPIECFGRKGAAISSPVV